MRTRVARWHIFKPKIQIWVNFGGYCNGRFWYILWPFGQFSGHLIYFMAIWYIFPHLAYFSLFWFVAQRKIWQPWCERWITFFYQMRFIQSVWPSLGLPDFSLNNVCIQETYIFSRRDLTERTPRFIAMSFLNKQNFFICISSNIVRLHMKCCLRSEFLNCRKSLHGSQTLNFSKSE
jgi:hypothetical protein